MIALGGERGGWKGDEHSQEVEGRVHEIGKEGWLRLMGFRGVEVWSTQRAAMRRRWRKPTVSSTLFPWNRFTPTNPSTRD